MSLTRGTKWDEVLMPSQEHIEADKFCKKVASEIVRNNPHIADNYLEYK